MVTRLVTPLHSMSNVTRPGVDGPFTIELVKSPKSGISKLLARIDAEPRFH
jgi:hypothetical protein